MSQSALYLVQCHVLLNYILSFNRFFLQFWKTKFRRAFVSFQAHAYLLLWLLWLFSPLWLTYLFTVKASDLFTLYTLSFYISLLFSVLSPMLPNTVIIILIISVPGIHFCYSSLQFSTYPIPCLIWWKDVLLLISLVFEVPSVSAHAVAVSCFLCQTSQMKQFIQSWFF